MSAADLKASVRAALSGNLWIDEAETGLRTEDAIMYVVAAQLKAIAIAAPHEDGPDTGGADVWVQDKALTRGEIAAAISGVAALLGNSRTMLFETEADEAAPNAPESEAAE